MKSWLARLRIAHALDFGKPVPAAVWRAIAASSEIRAFQEDAEEVVGALKNAKPTVNPPPWLHDSIMRALREPAGRATAPVHLRVLRWAIGPVVLALALLAGRWGMQRPASRPEALAAATAAFELGNDVSRTVPGAVMDPLSDELDRVQRDLDNTAQLLLTAMP